MCLILDNNSVHRVLLKQDETELLDLKQALLSPNDISVRIVYGGKLREEYETNADVRRVVATLDKAGRARKIPDNAVDLATQSVVSGNLCKSDDPHIIVLALVANVRLLCTQDKMLMDDFTNKEILKTPRGKIYTNGKHTHLLREACESPKR